VNWLLLTLLKRLYGLVPPFMRWARLETVRAAAAPTAAAVAERAIVPLPVVASTAWPWKELVRAMLLETGSRYTDRLAIAELGPVPVNRLLGVNDAVVGLALKGPESGPTRDDGSEKPRPRVKYAVWLRPSGR
jgi:hypothetical protein